MSEEKLRSLAKTIRAIPAVFGVGSAGILFMSTSCLIGWPGFGIAALCGLAAGSASFIGQQFCGIAGLSGGWVLGRVLGKSPAVACGMVGLVAGSLGGGIAAGCYGYVWAQDNLLPRLTELTSVQPADWRANKNDVLAFAAPNITLPDGRTLQINIPRADMARLG